MNRFDGFLRWAWSILIVCTLAFALGGCEGDDGKDGAAGAAGAAGPAGPAGPPGEDAPLPPVPDAVTASIDAAAVESCATCHDGVGDDHQALYDSYVDASDLVMTFTNFTSTPDGVGGFDVSLELSITDKGMPFTDYAGLEQKRFYVDRFDSATNQYFEAFTSINDSVVMVADGDYVMTEAGLSFDPTVNGQVYGYIAKGILLEHGGGTGAELPEGTHVHLYDDVASAAMAWGDAMVTDPDAYVSAANVEGCEACHGTPYMKHGYREAQVAGIPDFASCKVCHNDDGAGGHEDWQ